VKQAGGEPYRVKEATLTAKRNRPAENVKNHLILLAQIANGYFQQFAQSGTGQFKAAPLPCLI